MIRALMEKDVKLFFRNPLFAVVTVLVMVLFVAVYYLLPSTAEEELGLAVYVEGDAAPEALERFREGLKAQPFDSEAALVEAVEGGDYPAGIVFTSEALARAARGEEADVKVYYTPGITSELRQAYDDILTVAINYTRLSAEDRVNIETHEEVMGPDLLGEAIPARDRFMPAMLLIILVVELFGLSTIIMQEVEEDTVTALLTTPLQVDHFVAGKAVKGFVLSFGQALFVVVVTGLIFRAPLLLLVTLLLGSLLVVGLGFIVAALASDMMSAMSWGVLLYIALLIPGLAVLFPGVAGQWIKAIPSHYFVTAVHRIVNFGATWSDVVTALVALFAAGVMAVIAGSLLLRRRFS
jgi:ABC-2 type transport system permease protein